jgi:hypothetical protein
VIRLATKAHGAGPLVAYIALVATQHGCSNEEAFPGLEVEEA